MSISSVYKHYEGSDIQCSGVQLERELVWAKDIGASGALRYLDCSGNVHYISGEGGGDLYWEEGTVREEFGSETFVPAVVYKGLNPLNPEETPISIGRARLNYDDVDYSYGFRVQTDTGTLKLKSVGDAVNVDGKGIYLTSTDNNTIQLSTSGVAGDKDGIVLTTNNKGNYGSEFSNYLGSIRIQSTTGILARADSGYVFIEAGGAGGIYIGNKRGPNPGETQVNVSGANVYLDSNGTGEFLGNARLTSNKVTTISGGEEVNILSDDDIRAYAVGEVNMSGLNTRIGSETNTTIFADNNTAINADNNVNIQAQNYVNIAASTGEININNDIGSNGENLNILTNGNLNLTSKLNDVNVRSDTGSINIDCSNPGVVGLQYINIKAKTGMSLTTDSGSIDISPTYGSIFINSGAVFSENTTHDQVADPGNPAQGQAKVWFSNGTGAGDTGDLMVKINVGGTTKTVTLIDWSAA